MQSSNNQSNNLNNSSYLSNETYQTNTTHLVPDGFADRDENVRSSLDELGTVDNEQTVGESTANKTEEQNETTDSSLVQPLTKQPNISARKKSSKEEELPSKNFESYLADVYDVIKELRKKLVKEIKELKQYLLEMNQNNQLNSKDKENSLNLYHFQKDADFIVEKDIGERDGKEILQDKVDSILGDIESLDGAWIIFSTYRIPK